MPEKKISGEKEEQSVISSLKPFTEKEEILISEVVAAVWYFFGKPNGHKIDDYFMPVQLAFQLFRIRSPKKRVRLFKELMEAEGALIEAVNLMKETREKYPDE